MSLERYTFSLKSEFPEGLSINLFENTLDDLRQLLSHIEFALTGDIPVVDWKVEADGIHITASVNGLPAAQLEGILEDTYGGFRANEYGDEEDWPSTYDEKTKQIVKRIAKRARKIAPVIVETLNKTPLRIESIKRIETHRHERYIAWSSIEGTLDVISVHRRPFFAIYEHGSNNRIRCTFPDDWVENVVKLLGKRVVVEGLIYYRQNGEAYQLSKPDSIEIVPEPQTDMLALRGTIPGMTGELSTYEYIRQLRDKDELD